MKPAHSAGTPSRFRAALRGALAAIVATSPGVAAALRDPTVPPPFWGAPAVGAREPMSAFRPGHLVVVDGRRYLLWQGRRYREGESIEGARIERIEETEVWLRSNGSLRKVPVFAGIEKRPAGSPGANREMQK